MSLHLDADEMKNVRRNIIRKLAAALLDIIQSARICFYRTVSNADTINNPKLLQPMWTCGLGIIEFAEKVKIGVFPSPMFLSTYGYLEVRNAGARISIGENTWINNNFTAIAEHTSIKIGCRVVIGTSVEIYDSDFHGLLIENRGSSNADWSKPVIIEDDVFIGSNVRVLKGVTIGRGSVVANSSVVTKDLPSDVIAGGVPARVIRAISMNLSESC